MCSSGARNKIELGQNENINIGKKRSREESESVAVENILPEEKTDSLTVKFDPLKEKSVKKQRKKFYEIIAQKVRETFSPRITCWENVPENHIEAIFYQLSFKFTYPRDIIVLDEIEKLQKKALREWQYKMKCHWKQLGGEKNKEDAMKTPYENVKLEDWKIVCDIFSSGEQKDDAVTQMRDLEPAATAESATSIECGEEVPLEHCLGKNMTSPSHHHDSICNSESFDEKDKIIASLREQLAIREEQIASQRETIAVHQEHINTQGGLIATHREQGQLLAQIQKLVPGFAFQ